MSVTKNEIRMAMRARRKAVTPEARNAVSAVLSKRLFGDNPAIGKALGKRGPIAVSNDYPGCRFVTVGMSEVVFRKSVHLRAVLRFDVQKKRVGTTSVTYHVDVYRRDIEASDEEHVFHTDITFVHVDPSGAKLPLV